MAELALADETNPDGMLDREEVEQEIAEGVKARKALIENKNQTWTHWSVFIRGFRALRSLCFEQAHTSDVRSQAYRTEISRKLKLVKYSAYDIDSQTRSDCYALMDHIEDIDLWYAALPAEQQLRWTHPQTIRKNCPQHFVGGGKGHNRPPVKSKGKKLKGDTAEVTRLKALLIQVVRRLMKHEPEAAALLEQLYPEDPSDPVDDL